MCGYLHRRGADNFGKQTVWKHKHEANGQTNETKRNTDKKLTFRGGGCILFGWLNSIADFPDVHKFD